MYKYTYKFVISQVYITMGMAIIDSKHNLQTKQPLHQFNISSFKDKYVLIESFLKNSFDYSFYSWMMLFNFLKNKKELHITNNHNKHNTIIFNYNNLLILKIIFEDILKIIRWTSNSADVG